ncbi:MAG: signal peptidase II [bacterium]|nr:signal peptidase II [bacterium]
MTKTNKIIYLITSIVFYTIINFYFSKLILDYRFMLDKNPILDFVYAYNTGAAFSLMENMQFLLIIFSAIAIFSVLYFTIKNIQKFSTITLFWTSMLISGIFCNLVERIFLGYVLDYFKLNFIDFPVFNISDIFINISVIALIIIIVKNKYLKNDNFDN